MDFNDLCNLFYNNYPFIPNGYYSMNNPDLSDVTLAESLDLINWSHNGFTTGGDEKNHENTKKIFIKIKTK